MKNTLKKVMASVMAVASLAVGMTGISASAADDVKNIDRYQGPTTDIEFGYGAHAYAYADSTTINVGTKAQNQNIVAGVQIIAVTATTYNGDFLIHYHIGEVYYNTSGTGITYVKSRHTANGYTQDVSRYVS